MKRGFTMIELIFSIVIIAIIGSISADIIVRVYEQYVSSRDIERGQNDARRVLDQIGAMLQRRVKNSTIGRNTTNDAIISITNNRIDTTYNMLEWVGIAVESQRGQLPPTAAGGTVPSGWSGVATLTDASDGSGGERIYNLHSPQSNLVTVAAPIEATYKVVATAADAALFSGEHVVMIFAGDDMRGDTFGEQNGSWLWNAGNYNSSYFRIHNGFNETNFTVSSFNTDQELPLAAVSASKIKPYYLARSAYAVMIEDNNLTLYSGFRPWLGERYDTTAAHIKKSILMSDVQRFVFNETGSVVRLVLCIKASDNVAGNNDDNMVQFCREKVVL